MNATESAIRLEDVRFSYGKGREVLRIRDFETKRGEHVFVFGPSGSGKTTLLGLLAGVLRASSGAVRVLGQDLTAMSPSQRDAFRASHIGYIFQLFNLIPYLNVRDNITLPCKLSRDRIRRVKDASLRVSVQRIADHLGIAQLLNESVTNLSVGQQQRVAAARSLIGTPELVIADEPTSSLDYDHRERFVELLFQECRDSGSTLIFVSHDRTLMPLFHRCVSLSEINEAD